MPAPLSLDLRCRIVQAYLAKEGSYDELSVRFSVGRATVSRYLRRQRETGSVAAKPTGGSESILSDEDVESTHLIVYDRPDITIAALHEKFVADGGSEGVSPSTLWRAVGRLGLTRKKKRSSTSAGRTRT